MNKVSKRGHLVFVSKIFILSRKCYVIMPLLKGCAKGLLFWIVERQRDCENSFEVRLTSSGLDNGIDGPGITWGVYAIDSMDASACANAHCPRYHERRHAGQGKALPMCQPSSHAGLSLPVNFERAKCMWSSKRWGMTRALLHDPQNEERDIIDTGL